MNFFLWFSLLFLLSLFALFFCAGCFALKGAILLLWAVLGLIRGLWMAELVFFGYIPQVKTPSVPAHGLAEALSLNRGKGLAREYSYRASSALTGRSLIAVLLGGLYLFWMVAMIFIAKAPDSSTDLSGMIGTFLSREGSATFMPAYPSPVLIMNDFAEVLTAGLVFWLAQTFATSYRQGHIFLAMALSAFVVIGGAVLFTRHALPELPQISLAGHWIGYGFGMAALLQPMGVIPETTLSSFHQRAYEMGMGGTVYLYVLGLYLMLSFLAALSRDVYQKGQAVLGLLVILALVLADHFFPADQRLAAFWAAGWGALGILSVQCRSIGHQSARLHQS